MVTPNNSAQVGASPGAMEPSAKIAHGTPGRIAEYFRGNIRDGRGGGSRVGGLMVAWAVFALIKFAMPLPDGMTEAGKATLAVVVWASIMWVFEAVPVGVTGLAVPMMLVLSGALAEPEDALSGFTQQEVFLALSAFIFAAVMHLSGLDRKLALGILRKLRVKSATGACTGLFFANCISAFIIPGAVARAAALLPVVAGMRELLGTSETAARAIKGVVIQGLVYAPMISGVFLLTGGLPNLIITNTIAAETGVTIGYGSWFALNWVYLLLFIPLHIWISWLFKTRRARFDAVPVSQAAADETPQVSVGAPSGIPEDKPGLSGQQIATLAVFSAVAAAWALLPDIKPGIIGLVGVLLLFTPGLIPIDWKKVQANTMWGSFLLLGGALSMTLAMAETGLGDYLANAVAPLAQGRGWFLILLIFMVGTQFIRLGMLSNVAAVAMLVPILVPLAVRLDVNPISFTMLIANIDTFAFVLPTQISAAVIAYGTDTFTMKDYAKAGTVSLGIAMVFTLVVVVPWYAFMGVPIWSTDSLNLRF